MFINRISELQILNDEYAKNGTRFAVIYGRRRVGKTALISEFIKDKNALYFYATTANDSPNRFGKALAKTLNLPFADKLNFDNFTSAFELFNEVKFDQKLIIAIDEFQNLAINDKNFIGEFQFIYDTIIAKKNIFLIICGSVISMFYSLVLNYNAPLYGRRTINLHIKPLKFRHICEFLPSLDRQTQLFAYCSFGSIPKYLENYDESKDFWQNLSDNILDKSSYLYAEGQFLLNSEISESASYFSILETISKGNTKISSIAGNLGVNSTYLSRYLQKLIELDLVQKELPITETNPLKSKFGRYKISDKYLAFWFYYVYKNYSFLEIDNKEAVLDEIKNNFNDRFVSFGFEEVVKEMIMDDFSLIGFKPQKIGRWWDNKNEIDFIAFDDNNVCFIECKWQNSVKETKILSDLKEKSLNLMHDRNLLGKKISYKIFTKEWFLKY
ncbi:MAG: ATP-binding protein [Campylobacter sp.]|nr:ATP-binding protein [Campylobacter sp.]